MAETRGAFGLLHIRTNKHTSTDGHAWGWLDTAPPGSSQRLLEENGLRIEWNGSKGLASAAFAANRLNSHDDLVAALEAHQEWADKENAGPQYPPGMSRDAPGGEEIWRAWWNEQLDLCDRASKLTRTALALARGQEQEKK